MDPSSIFKLSPQFDQSSVVELQCSSSYSVPGDEVFAAFEQLSNSVEKFKARALSFQAEQDNLLMALTLAKDKYSSIDSEDGLTSKFNFLIQSLYDVDIKVSTARSMQEDEALHQINSLIDQLICPVEDNQMDKKIICNNYIKSCNSGICVEMSETYETSVNSDFYSLITKCTVDDQNRVRMRLTGLLAYLESQEKVFK